MSSNARCVAVIVIAVLACGSATGRVFAHASRQDASARPEERIAGVVDEVADGARAVDDPVVRHACWLGAAALVWKRSPERARAIYIAAFDDLRRLAADGHDAGDAYTSALAALMAETGRHDPALAEQFADRLADAGRTDASQGASRAEALVEAAIAMLPDEPARAEALGRMALSGGVSEALMQLVIVLHGVDPRRGDALYGAALSVFARTPNPTLADVQMLAAYIGADGQNAPYTVAPDQLRAFLSAAVRMIEATALDSDDAQPAYFLGRSMTAAVAHFAPDASGALAARLALLSRSAGFQRSASSEQRPDAGLASDPHAAAALAAIDRGDFKALCAEAAAIDDDRIRTSLFSRMTVAMLNDDRIGEAALAIDKVPYPMRRAQLYVQRAYAARSKADLAIATESLAAADKDALREPVPAFRVRAAFEVAAAWVDVDTLGAFESASGAIATLNKAALAAGGDTAAVSAYIGRDDMFEGTLGRLSRKDFERALLIARQLDNRGYRLLAELAVCRGGLADPGDDESPGDGASGGGQ